MISVVDPVFRWPLYYLLLFGPMQHFHRERTLEQMSMELMHSMTGRKVSTRLLQGLGFGINCRYWLNTGGSSLFRQLKLPR